MSQEAAGGHLGYSLGKLIRPLQKQQVLRMAKVFPRYYVLDHIRQSETEEAYRQRELVAVCQGMRLE